MFATVHKSYAFPLINLELQKALNLY